MSSEKKSLAIVGSGIAGLGCAYHLREHYRITVFDANDYVGGHTNTIELESKLAFDTGFMVFNYETYPLLTALFKELSVPVKKTDMSFSVQAKEAGIEWNGAGLGKIFAQRKNLLSPRFWRMLLKLDWFNKNAPSHLQDPALASLSVGDYVRKYDLGEDFLNWYLVPMGSSVWSTEPGKMLEFPAHTLIRFFYNHGFLGMDTHFQWYTVDGGAREYVKRILARLKPEDRVLLNSPVQSVERLNGRVQVTWLQASGADISSETFDQVILASHADQALALLKDARAEEKRLLRPFRYQQNPVLVHTDARVMPACKNAWASWNYRVEKKAADKIDATTHYWMNNLQGLPGDINYFVSLNSGHLIDESKVVRKLSYTHPLFDLATARAQTELHTLNENGDGLVFFAGSYFRYGFHEDAYMSAVNLTKMLLQRVPSYV